MALKWTSNAKEVPVPNIAERGTDLGEGVVTWSNFNSEPLTILTEKERDRLVEKHGTPRFDRIRAQRVKGLMNKELSVREIANALYPLYGRGYSLRSITTVHAALNPHPTGAIGEGRKKRSNSTIATRKVKLII